jgi:hypothetical protein
LAGNIVPIIPDEARTFGLDALVPDIGIYSPKGQLYEPVDKESLLYYHEAKDGQILEEGITEAGSMASFIAAGTSYATHGVPMIPFYIYYSMFGPQRVGDLFWLAGDIRQGLSARRTAGRTTLNGEGPATSGRPQPAARQHHSDLPALRPGVSALNWPSSSPTACAGCMSRARTFFITSRSTTKITPCRRCPRASRTAF